MRKLTILLCSLALAACATTANYEKILNQFVGQKADSLLTSWGPPARSYNLSTGERVLEYNRQSEYYTGGEVEMVPLLGKRTTTSHTTGTGGDYDHNSESDTTVMVPHITPRERHVNTCTTRFTVSPSDIITRWDWSGNDCTAFEQGSIFQRTGSSGM